MSTCRRCGVRLRPQRSDAPWRTRQVARGLCKPCYGHLNNTGGLVDYERVNRPRDDLLDDYVVLRDQGFNWRQCAEKLRINYRTFETAMYRARRDGDPRAAKPGELNRPEAGAA